MIVADFSQYNQSTLAHDGTQWWFEWGVSDQLHTVRINAAGTVLDPNGGVLLPIVIGGNINTAYSPLLSPGSAAACTCSGTTCAWRWATTRTSSRCRSARPTCPAPSAASPPARAASACPTSRPGPAARSPWSSSARRRTTTACWCTSSTPTASRSPPSRIEVAAAAGIGKAGIAWNGSLYLVTWDDGAPGIKARRLNADGTFVDAAPVDVMPGFSPDVEALGEDFLIACARYDTYPQFIYAWMRIVDGPTGAFQNAATLIGGGYVNVGPARAPGRQPRGS